MFIHSISNEVKKNFMASDKDGDGILTTKEFLTALWNSSDFHLEENSKFCNFTFNDYLVMSGQKSTNEVEKTLLYKILLCTLHLI